jgi:hypothetical protein
MKSTIYIPFFGIFLLLSGQGFSQEVPSLFQKKDVLPIKIESNIKVLINDKGDKPTFHWAALSYSDKQGKTVKLPIRTKVRGNFRRTSGNCKFPPLLIDFSQNKTENTLFSQQTKLKLVTQCQTEAYLIQEYLVYEIYNILTDLSFKAKLVEVTYVDSLGKRKDNTDYGFFIEEETLMAKRNNAKNDDQKKRTQSQLVTEQMIMLALFEYMIGNNDWEVSTLHNIKMLIQTGNLLLPVPYDFDHAGIVEAQYALPPPQLEIASVRERLYRGLNYDPSVFQIAFAKFNNHKPQIYAVYENNPLLSAGYIKRTLKYLDEFYEHINDPKAISKYFVAGRTKN